jgi:DNA-directed RNA polymerase subunit omega
MIHPSYVELMKVVNEGTDVGEEPVVNSRYSIVCATAKRARQLIDGKAPLIDTKPKEKPLSIAVDELYTGQLQILTDEEAEQMAADEAELVAKIEQRQKEAEAEAEASRKENEDAEEAEADEPDEDTDDADDIADVDDDSADDSENPDDGE